MTRLKKEDIIDITQKLPAYDADLVRKTGLSLKERLIHDVLEIGVAAMFVHASCVQ